MKLNHGDRVRTTDGSGIGIVICHTGKNVYGENIVLVNWDIGTSGQVSEKFIEKLEGKNK